MSVYAISDVHGEYDLFLKLLEKINFSNEDTLYVLGDFIDKGKKSLNLLKYIYERENIRAILGNHEQYFLSYYDSLMWDFKESTNEADILKKLQGYFPEDTEILEWEHVDFLEGLPAFIEEDEFICVHAGVQLDYDTNCVLSMREQEPSLLFNDRRFANNTVIPKNSKTILYGHTPCHYENGSGEFIKTPREGQFYNGKNLFEYVKIRLDTGVHFTRMLGVLRLDDMQEFYVNE